MFWKKEDNKNIELLEHRVQQLEDQHKQLEDQITGLKHIFAIKLVEKIVFALCGAILMGVVTSAISGVSILSFFGG